ncbi:MAG: FecR family protein [Sphingobacteriaceae bacterium]|nr:MAG: FecR family protein [Sphingobacteriaceae bacterium]
MNNKQLAELLDKYVKGLCTADEAAVINNWYDKHKDNPEIIDILSDKKRELLKVRMLNNVLQQIDSDNNQGYVSKKRFVNSWWIKLSVAAALLIFVKIIYSGYRKDSATVKLSNIRIRNKITNNTRNILKQILPDKSIVWLNPQAKLEFPKNFNKNSRDVIMEGECFFEVSKNSQRPFIIQSRHLITKVWGTSFKVSDNFNAATAQVTVVTGKVSVSTKISNSALVGNKLNQSEIILLPKQATVFKYDNKRFYTSRNADVSDLSLYEHINLLFDNEKLVNIVAVLNKKFNTDIRLEDKSLNNQVMDADLSGLNLPEVLEVLKASLQLSYEMSNNVIKLSKPVKL